MDDGLRTSRAVRERAGLRDRVAHWFLLHGDREVVAGLVVVAVVVVVGGLVALGVLAVGPSSSAATVLGSGLTAGVVTLVTIALSINQLILSRVFGSPNELADRLAGTHDLRRLVERHADRPSSPNDPAAFLSLTATTLSVRAADLQAAIAASAWEPPGAVASAIQDVVDYGRNVDRHLEDRTDIVDVLDVVLGTGYARNMTAVRHLGEAYDESLSPAARQHLEAVDELLEAVAVARQFFKTLAIQQDFAHLSRLVVYTGLVALVVAVSLTLVYRTGTTTLPADVLPVVVTLGIGVVVTPLAAFVSYLLRAATIAYRTVSVGPFVPPDR